MPQVGGNSGEEETIKKQGGILPRNIERSKEENAVHAENRGPHT